MKTQKLSISIMAVFLWIGFVCAISFMEAWLKFKAPGMTISLGLSIGKIVFAALNKVEWFFGIIIGINLLLTQYYNKSVSNLFFYVAFLLLIVQTFYLLPALDIRAQSYIQGLKLPPSNLHFYFVGGEIIKVFCLSIFGFTLFNKKISL